MRHAAGGWLGDLRHAARQLRAAPGFTLVAVLTLALGIGMNTAIFSVVNATLLRPFPYPESHRLVVPAVVWQDGHLGSVTYADHLDWRAEPRLFEHVAVFQAGSANLAGEQEPERVPSAQVSDDFFAVFRTRPELGRGFTREEHLAAQPGVAILSDRLWRRRFGGDADVVGKTVRLNGASTTVVGVMPRSFDWPLATEVWRPIPVGSIPPADLTRRDNFIWQAVARLHPGTTPQEASARLAAMARVVSADEPAGQEYSATVTTLHEAVVGSDARRALLVLLGAVASVLLIACVNIANLLLARAAGRSRELALRAALGAGRLRLVRQLLTESVLLGVLGAAAGILVGLWAIRLLVRVAPSDLARVQEAALDPVVLAFTFGVALVTMLVFGLLPALQASRGDLEASLRESGRRVSGSLRARATRRALVVTEVAVSLVLLIGAGLMLKSFAHLQHVDPGVRTDRVLTMALTVPTGSYAQPSQRTRVFEEVVARARALPGVRSASATSALPLGGGGIYLGRAFLAEGAADPPASPEHLGQWNAVTPGYFEAAGIPLVRGRDFTAKDDSAAVPVAILSRTMARRLFGDGDAIGRRLRSWRDENVLREVVGVVEDIRYFGLTGEEEPLVYVPHAQNAWTTMYLTVRTAGDPAALIAPVRRTVREVDPDLPVSEVRTLDQVLGAALAPARATSLLLGVFGSVALLLAAVGVYGVIAYSVAQRTQEIGVRMAMGARARDIGRLVLGQGALLALGGVLAGVVLALVLGRVIASLLYRVSSADPAVFAGLSLLLIGVAVVASWIPARRAMRVDPMVALRYE